MVKSEPLTRDSKVLLSPAVSHKSSESGVTMNLSTKNHLSYRQLKGYETVRLLYDWYYS